MRKSYQPYFEETVQKYKNLLDKNSKNTILDSRKKFGERKMNENSFIDEQGKHIVEKISELINDHRKNLEKNYVAVERQSGIASEDAIKLIMLSTLDQLEKKIPFYKRLFK